MKCAKQTGAKKRKDKTMIRQGLFAISLLACTRAVAHDLHADADPANDWIQGLTNSEKALCCGTNDCYPLHSGALRISADGELTVQVEGAWYPVLEPYLLRDASPDGRAWVCPRMKSTAGGYVYSVQSVRCLLLPMVM
jgi:hypothetical protein